MDEGFSPIRQFAKMFIPALEATSCTRRFRNQKLRVSAYLQIALIRDSWPMRFSVLTNPTKSSPDAPWLRKEFESDIFVRLTISERKSFFQRSQMSKFFGIILRLSIPYPCTNDTFNFGLP